MNTVALVRKDVDPPTVAQAPKMLRASNPDLLEPLKGSSALADGQVNIISLDAIVDAFGDRWQGRREGVYEHVEKVIDRHLGLNGYVTRISETDFLIAQPDLGPFGAQAACLRTLREVLSHFLGAVRPGALSVCRVTRLEGSDLTAVPVDARMAMDGEAREVAAARAAAEAEADPTLLSPDRWSPFTAGNGKRVRVSCKLEPVFELKGSTRIGYRLTRRVVLEDTDKELSPGEVRNLTRADLLRIDMATISRGVARLKSEQHESQELSLIVPVSYVSLSTVEGRKVMKTAFDQARQWVLKGVICEICDIEDVPQGPLLSVISLIKPASLLVVGHLSGDTPRVTSSLKDTGLQAISVVCPPHLAGDAEFLGWARETVKSVRRVTRSVMVHGCSSPRRLAMAGLMEATHASLGSD